MPKDTFDISDKNIILTGGLGLLGLNFTKALTEKGARVFILDLPSAEEADRILESKLDKEELKLVNYFQADITDREALIKIKEKLPQKANVLINNAAVNPTPEESATPFEENQISDWKKYFDINVIGSMLCSQIFGADFDQGGSIINISSIYGLVGPDQRIYKKGFTKPVGYGASKGAIIALTKYLAVYLAEKQIRVNAIVPGGVLAGQDDEFVKKYCERVPLGRMAKEDELNGMLIYLISDSSSYSTGSIYAVDGGYTAW